MRKRAPAIIPQSASIHSSVALGSRQVLLAYSTDYEQGQDLYTRVWRVNVRHGASEE
jgi:hypothetical protein